MSCLFNRQSASVYFLLNNFWVYSKKNWQEMNTFKFHNIKKNSLSVSYKIFKQKLYVIPENTTFDWNGVQDMFMFMPQTEKKIVLRFFYTQKVKPQSRVHSIFLEKKL